MKGLHDSYRRIAVAFSEKARYYNTNADLQQQLIIELLEGIRLFPSPDGLWLDIGTGTGLFEKSLAASRRPPRIIGVDIAVGSLSYARTIAPVPMLPVIADMHQLPFAPGSFSRIIMTSALQWSTSPSEVLSKVKKTLKPGGQFLFAVFLEDYLFELGRVYQEFGTTLEVFLPSLAQFESLVCASDMSIVWSKRITGRQYFPSALTLIKHLVAIGASARSSGRVHRSVFEICRRYSQRFATPEGVPLSFDALVGVASATL